MWKVSLEKLLSSKRKFTLCIFKYNTVSLLKVYEVNQISMIKRHNCNIEKEYILVKKKSASLITYDNIQNKLKINV